MLQSPLKTPSKESPGPALQRSAGRARIVVARKRGQTRLADLFQEGSAKIRFPASPSSALEAVLINTAGGMTGGDRLHWQAEAAAAASLTLTTPASEKAYRAGEGEARVDVALRAGQGARLAWLPQETILFDGAAVTRRIEVDLAGDAELLLVEPLVFGRSAMGETVRECHFRNSWRVRVGGKLIHAEEFRLHGDAQSILAARAVAAGATAMASILAIGGQAPSRLAEVRALLARHPDLVSAASHVSIGRNGKLLARLVAGDGYSLRKALSPLVGLLNGAAGLPKIWAT